MSENNQDGICHPKDKVVKKLWRFNYKYVLTSLVFILTLGANVFFSSNKFEKEPDLTAFFATPANAANPLPSNYEYPTNLRYSQNYVNASVKTNSTVTKLGTGEQLTYYTNTTPVWISLSPNAYAYHKTYSCAANRTKYEVIKVTTTEAREKYHRTPCKICQPK